MFEPVPAGKGTGHGKVTGTHPMAWTRSSVEHAFQRSGGQHRITPTKQRFYIGPAYESPIGFVQGIKSKFQKSKHNLTFLPTLRFHSSVHSVTRSANML
ncbi:MAG: hypothetical protein PHE55_00780 [Methylococcaceae bacterium]|nr:hypothetical protein [Methylococcaceae bacterium]